MPAEGAAYLEGLQFSQLAANQPAEQSFYLLEAGRQELFHLNRAYEILEVLSPSEPLPEEPISAFTIGQDRVLFVAIGGEIFTAQLP